MRHLRDKLVITRNYLNVTHTGSTLNDLQSISFSLSEMFCRPQSEIRSTVMSAVVDDGTGPRRTAWRRRYVRRESSNLARYGRALRQRAGQACFAPSTRPVTTATVTSRRCIDSVEHDTSDLTRDTLSHGRRCRDGNFHQLPTRPWTASSIWISVFATTPLPDVSYRADCENCHCLHTRLHRLRSNCSRNFNLLL